MNEILSRLKEPFASTEVKYRLGNKYDDGRKALLFLYVDARACQDRLDEVLGAEGWNTAMRIEPISGGGAVAVCELTAIVDKQLIVRTDCCELEKAADAKGAASTAFKRACAALGIGRYLYNVGNIRIRLDGGYFRGEVLLADEFLPESERCGRTEIEIRYSDASSASYEQPSVDNAPRSDATYPPDLKSAMELTITTGNCKGKTIGEVGSKSVKSVGWLIYNGTPEEREAAKKAYNYLTTAARTGFGTSEVVSASTKTTIEDVDIPF